MIERSRLPAIVTVTAVERPARKLIFLRSEKATEYFSFCKEMGCDWHEILNNIPEKFDTSALLKLPQGLVKDGTSAVAAGVEVPFDYTMSLPQGYEITDLPSCKMLYFQGMPFEDEADFGEAIGIVGEAIASYKPERYGYCFVDDVAPMFNFGASAENGAKMAVPVECLK